MEQVEGNAAMGGVGQPGVSLFVQGRDTVGPAVWIGVLGAVWRDGEGSVEHPYEVYTPYHDKVGKALC